MLSISTFIFAIIKSNSWGITSLKTWTLLLTSIILSTLLYFVEKKSASPIIKFSLFINKNFFAGILANFFLAFFYCLAFFLMPLFLHNIRGESDYIVGLMLLPTTLMVALMSPLVGRIVDRKGPRKPLLWGFILFTISALLQVNFSSSTSIFVIIIAFIIMGVAWGTVVGPSTIIAMSALPASSQGVAIGMSWTLHNIGGTLGLSLGILIYHLQLERHANSFIAGYHGAMSLLVFSSFLCFLISSGKFPAALLRSALK
jgi:MFS family permease